MRTVAFILKRVPSDWSHTGTKSVFMSHARGCRSACASAITGPSLYDPTWALHWGETNNTNLRFTGVLGYTEWMEVFCGR